MRTEWLNKNVEPSRLCSSVEDFFKGRGLSTKKTFSKGKNRIEAFLADADSVPFVIVEIYGDLGRIIVDFLPWGKKELTAWTTLFSSVLTLFGGGVLVRQDLKRKELMEEVEDQLCDFLDRRLLELAS